MKLEPSIVLIAALGVFLVPVLCLAAPPQWNYYQRITVDTPGAVRVKIPYETLDASRPDRGDLRILSPEGQPIPYYPKRVEPDLYRFQDVRTFEAHRSDTRTWIQLVTGVNEPIDAVRFSVREQQFFKPVTIHGSQDLKRWTPLVDRAVLFGSPDGPRNLEVDLPNQGWKYLRIIMDDRRSAPVRVPSIQLGIPPAETIETDRLRVPIVEQRVRRDESVLELNFPAHHLPIRSLHLDVEDPVFKRRLRLETADTGTDPSSTSKTLASGTLFKLEDDTFETSQDLNLVVNGTLPNRRARLIVENGDHPPLTIRSVHARIPRLYLVFWARRSGIYTLLSGNPVAERPDYDLGWIEEYALTDLHTVTPGTPVTNTRYRRPERLPSLPTTGASINTDPWAFRKPVRIESAGIKQIELQPDVLAHAGAHLQDLRLVSEGRQIPYVLDETVIRRSIVPDEIDHRDSVEKNRSISRWSFTMPHSNLPLLAFSARVKNELFEREVVLYERKSSPGVSRPRRVLGRTTWRRTPKSSDADQKLTLPIRKRPNSDQLHLEIHNGDNAPLDLTNPGFHYRTHRLYFKVKKTEEVMLYYGNPSVPEPEYDLSLVAYDLLSSKGKTVSTGEEEPLKQSWWRRTGRSTLSRTLFWGIMVLVVAGLLFVIARLLPRVEET